MKHIKRGYSWIFTRLAAIFGLTIGVQVTTITPATAIGDCKYSGASSTVEVDGKTFKFCTTDTARIYCNYDDACNPKRRTRLYFFFVSCPTGYYANYTTGDKITPSLLDVTDINTSTCSSYNCYNTPESSIAAWEDITAAKASASSAVTCTKCPPFGTTSAQSTGGGKISTCYMSSANNPYTDETGTFSWSSDCYITTQ